MVEHARAHVRLDTAPPAGDRFAITGVLDRPITVYIPPHARDARTPVLLVHFNGAAYVPTHAVAAVERPVILAAVHLGAGSGVYARAFAEPGVLDRIRQAVADSLTARRGSRTLVSSIMLSGFSAGYGAIREMLADPGTAPKIDGVLLLDGLHTGYLPPRVPLADGGALDSALLQPFLEFAGLATRELRTMVITHSEIFPGTFASTTETSDYLLRRLGLTRTPVLEWGPVGMQMLSTAGAGRLVVLGFAGNTAPDHVDHYHGMAMFLSQLLDMAEADR
jgi:hypothetical protein